MKLKFEKNIQFTRTIKADNRLREFNFRKLGGIEESIFTVDVVDDRVGGVRVDGEDAGPQDARNYQVPIAAVARGGDRV